MKVLILNGSPHKGDTRYILEQIKEKFPTNTEFVELNAYKENIKPCNDCRYCWKNKGCVVKDQMEIITKDDYDILIIASPIYMSYLTPPLFSIITRLNYIWSNNYFLKIPNSMKKKKGILVLVGGGDGSPDNAISISKTTFRLLNAEFDIDKDYISSLDTNHVSAKEDNTIEKQINKTIEHILTN